MSWIADFSSSPRKSITHKPNLEWISIQIKKNVNMAKPGDSRSRPLTGPNSIQIWLGQHYGIFY
jgi:hypothetical protein